MKISNLLLSTTLCALASLNALAYDAKDWGAPESFAVVNPVVKSQYAQTISLSGEWSFTNDFPERYRLGVGGGLWGPQLFEWEKARKIQVPGIWEAQGVGTPAPGRTWDATWDCGMWDLKNVYVGRALYRRTFELPQNWNGNRVWLKVGGVASNAYLWINGKRAAYVDAYCGARKYDVTALINFDEENEITALVRNDVPSRIGLFAVNERFGGFFRDVELEATPNLYVDDVWARGNVDSKSADVRVYVKHVDENGNAFPTYDDELAPREREMLDNLRQNGVVIGQNVANKETYGSIEVTIKTLDGKIVGAQKKNATVEVGNNGLANAFRFNIPIENCKLWTPESPNLYLADVVLTSNDGKTKHGWTERFGVREFKVVGDRFFLNGKPYFLRGGGDHNYDQINLIEPADRERFREHMTIYKTAGFNYMRFHTHSPFPEYFESADEKGILLQPELPYYHDVTCEGFPFNPKRDMYELFRANRRYVSFATYSYGNEGSLGKKLGKEMYDWVKKYDPDRLVIHQDGGTLNKPGFADFTTNGTNGASIINPWEVGAHDDVDAPFIAHEYLNLSIKMDPRYESRFTGVRKAPVSVQAWLDKLNALGLDEHWGAACIAASEKLQAIYQKRGLEAARLDPKCDGYSFWSLVDASIPQGSCVAAQGYLNPFWEPRPNGNQPETFAQFNGPVAILLETDLDAPILTANQRFNADFAISYFAENATPASKLLWDLRDKATGDSIVKGKTSFDTIEPGFAGKIGSASIRLPDAIEKPIAAELVVAIEGQKITNSWNFWVFPKREKKSLKGFAVSNALYDHFAKHYSDVEKIDAKANVADQKIWITTPDEPEFYLGLSANRKVFAISPAAQTPNVSLGWWSLGTQVGATFADSRAFDKFPNSPDMDELWFRLVRVGAPDLATKPLGEHYEPLAVGEGRDSYYLYLGQTQFNKGSLLESFALDLIQETPEALALLDSLLDYVASPEFAPKKATDALKFTSYKVPDGVLWGFDELVSTNQDEFMPWKTLYEESVLMINCRQSNKEQKIVWKTQPATIDKDSQKTTFAFVGGLGYWSEPQTDGFELAINDAPAIRFDLPDKDAKVGEKIEWVGKDGVALTFEIGRVENPGPDFFGVFYLTVPNDRLEENAPLQLSTRSLGENSRRWFSISDYDGLRQTSEINNK